MNQHKQNGWIIQWEGDHEEYSKENKFVLIENDMNQIMVHITFIGSKIEFKTMLAESIEFDMENKVITVKSIPEPDYDFED